MALITTGRNPSSSATEDIEQLILNYYQELYRAALKGNWKEAKSFLDIDPDAVIARISNLKMTALHVAACEGHSEFVENIVELMPAGELAELDDLGYTALHYAAIGGSLRSAKTLLAANSNLTQVVDSEGRTPLLLAASLGSESKELVWYFLLVTTDEKPGQPFTGPRAAYLINVLIASGLHEISLYLLEKHPHLATAIDHQDNNCTPLFILARNQSNFLTGSRLGFWETCIYQFLPVEVNYGPPRSVRAYVGGHESVQDQLRMPTSAQNKVLEPRETILHLAAKLPPLPKLSSISGAALQMQRELQWFKVVENLVHPYYKEYPNKNLETARELFTKEHKELAERGENG